MDTIYTIYTIKPEQKLKEAFYLNPVNRVNPVNFLFSTI